MGGSSFLEANRETRQAGETLLPPLAIVGDDHPLFREGVATILAGLEPLVEVRQASTFAEVLDAARKDRAPEIFALDLRFPGMDLEKSVAKLRTEFPVSSIVIVTMCDDAASVRKVIAAGVDGLISKAVDSQVMREGFEALRRGEFVNVGGRMGFGPESEILANYPHLTQRQIDVLLLVAAGKTNKEIARELTISPFTVQIHVSAMLRSLHVEGRAAAAAIAAKYGL